jgi:hypothetical protein
MLDALVETLQHKLEGNQFVFLASVAAVSLFILLSWLGGSNAKSHYPLVGVDLKHPFFVGIRQRLQWFKQGPEIIHNSFKAFPNSIFTLPSLDRTSIVLPPHFLQEIRDLPGTIGSNSHATSDVSIKYYTSTPNTPCLYEFLTQDQFFVGNWTTLDYDIFAHATIDAIKTQYIAKIGQQIGPASKEAAYAFNKHFGRYHGKFIDYSPVSIGKIYHRTLELILLT